MSARIGKGGRTTDHLLNATTGMEANLRWLHDNLPESTWRTPDGVTTDAYRAWSASLAAAMAATKIAKRKSPRYTWRSPIASDARTRKGSRA